MTKKFGNSFKSYNKIPTHLIHLAGKMICYGTILYLYKNSQLKEKILMELHTSPLRGYSRFLKTYHRVKKDFFGISLNMIFKSLWQNVWFSNKIKLKQLRPWVYYNLYPFQVNVGRSFQWILSQVYPSPKERVSSWWYFIDLLSMCTFVHYLIPLKLV